MYYNNSEVLILNVRGQKMEIPIAIICTSANQSLLNVLLEENYRNRHEGNRSVYLATSPRMLDKILDYHLTGQLHLPPGMCADEIKRELEFWMLEERHLAECCWCVYREMQENEKMAEEVSMVMSRCAHVVPLPQGPNKEAIKECFTARLYRRLEDPGSCKVAMGMCAVSSTVALVTVLLYCLETVIQLRLPRKTSQNFTKDIPNLKVRRYLETETSPVIFYMGCVCLTYIALEMIVRFFCTPKKLRFFLDFLNLVDICVVSIGCVVAYYEFTGNQFKSATQMHVYFSLKAISTIVILRLLRPMKRVTLIRVLWLSLKSTKTAHVFLFLMLGFSTVIFAALIYVVEVHNEDFFWSIPESIWWAIITMTTVGYGDFYPKTGGGYATGAVCAVTGIIILALPIPILTNAFSSYHDCYLQLKRLRKREIKPQQNNTSQA